MFSKLIVVFLAVAMALVQVNAETHTVTFNNKCGRGTPYLKANDGQVLSTGAPYTINGSLIAAIACGNNGENCTLVETTLANGASGSDINLIPPHKFSVASGFSYYDGCDGVGADCTYADCSTAFHSPDQISEELVCTVDNENLLITFCD
ncbi:uncharacterized protein LAESUDRAFT_758553 [Laetiporus sulphureus 93-53]|uniref:Glycopeptide n=1 Tax=Laetiporus sulphureus 93-53 TaxID=1314785 RepID=A0A165EQG6_9APHY|nr:uncharacterized protein LAESUDRAFT_758553 [Laetiporus sulphureus 93-53]KZT07550.1 hypothetical protein LAESUDRAFT_758553 [Laetiporus sulphureus 93-53]